MIPILAQNWLTLRNVTSTAPITQSEPAWIDVSPYQDLVAWLEVKEWSTSSGSLFIAYQTAPSMDEAFFQNMNDTTVAITTGVSTKVLTKELALSPLSHWFRWQIFPTGNVTTWDITFRLWLTVDAPGRQARGRTAPSAGCGCAKG